MSEATKTETVYFSVKGQVVIPRRLRKEFDIEEGTRAQVYAENGQIVLKPITSKFIKSLRGSLKGTRAMETFMAERKRERDL
jgi:AbrB family looped-hinge helix DNA binding protein